MSRRSVSNHEQLDRYVQQLKVGVHSHAHRALIVVEKPPSGWLQAYAEKVEAPYIDPRGRQDRSDVVAGLLGRELSQSVHEIDRALDVGILAALSGTLKAGGVLVFGVGFSISDHDESPSRYIRRFSRLFLQHQQDFPSSTALLSFDGTTPHVPMVDDECVNHEALISQTYPAGLARLDTNSPVSTLADTGVDALTEQNELLLDTRNHLAKNLHCCIIITGRRGRGKSMLLARLATDLIEKKLPFAITSAHRSALTTLSRYCPAASAKVVAPMLTSAHDSKEQGSLLLVDEAASLPISVLTGFIERYAQIVLCTTVEGYESAGRAFDIRFTQQLKKRFPEILELQPQRPWRWADNDPLETFIDRLMLPTSNGARQTTRRAVYPAVSNAPGEVRKRHRIIRGSQSGVTIRQLDRTSLASNESLLASVHALLHDYHYQTTATDLPHMLDAPGLQIWVAEQSHSGGSMVVGALMLSLEGEIEHALHDAIVRKQRRLSHQLLPQLLAQCANRADALSEHYARVIRISIAPAHRRRGIGSSLLERVQEELAAGEFPVETLGASFADDDCSASFWRANGFEQFHRGYRLNPRTGTQSIAVIRSVNQIVTSSMNRAVLIHRDNQVWRDYLARQAGADTTQAVTSASNVVPAAENSPRTKGYHGLFDLELLHRFVDAERSAHDTIAAIGRLCAVHSDNTAETLLHEHSFGSANVVTRVSKRDRDTTLRKQVAALLAGDTAM